MPATEHALLQRAQQLVAAEQAGAAQRAVEAAAAVAVQEPSVEANAASLCERMVGHFQQLFDVPRLELVLAAINQVSGGHWHC